MKTLDDLAEILSGPPEEAAPHLLGAVLCSGVDGVTVRMRIGEVEAYKGGDDPASHTYRGPTARNRSMFGPPGTLYVYRSYGIHYCANTSAGPEGVGWGILIRGGDVVEGLPTVERRRGRRQGLTDGPGKVCQALGIDLTHNGTDLFAGAQPVWLEPGPPPEMVLSTPRIGLSKARERAWRYVAGVSANP